MSGSVGAGATVNSFSVDVSAPFSGALVKFSSMGLQSGIGFCWRETTYVILNNGTGTAVCTVRGTDGSAQLTHSVTISGNVVILKATTSAASADNTIGSSLDVTGNNAVMSRI